MIIPKTVRSIVQANLKMQFINDKLKLFMDIMQFVDNVCYFPAGLSLYRCAETIEQFRKSEIASTLENLVYTSQIMYT
jgi:hypothetical protein